MNNKINSTRVKEITKELIKYKTYGIMEELESCADYLNKLFEDAGINSRIVYGADGTPNVVADIKNGSGKKSILLNGHYDVVPLTESKNINPFMPIVKGNKIYGRGAVDMKSGLAALVECMLTIAENEQDFDGKIIFTGVGDEEKGSENGTIMLLKKGLKADSCINAEPTNMNLEIGNRGVIWASILVSGRSCHAGRPRLGINAIHESLPIMEALSKLEFEEGNNIFEINRGSLSITKIWGGTKVNVVPDTCKFEIDIRMMPEDNKNKILNKINKIVSKEGHHLRCEVDIYKYWPPFLISRDETIVDSLVKSYRRVLGNDPSIRGKAASTDGSFICGEAKIPTVLLGPGNGNLSHTLQEYVEIKNIISCSQIYVYSCIDFLTIDHF